ncbi:MAG: transcriptional regulator, partial [Rhizobium ruizarguesonis]
MKEGPDIAQIGALIGDPARANMLAALTGGRALTATELAGVGGIT